MASSSPASPSVPSTDAAEAAADEPSGESRVEKPAKAVLVRRFGWVVALMAFDLWSKQAVFAWLAAIQVQLVADSHGHERLPIFGEWFTFMRSLNYGAAFGRLDGSPWLLVCGRVVAVIFLIVLLFRAPLGRRIYNTALILILAGALGNLYDNFFHYVDADTAFGPVRDFIDVYFSAWDWHFPTFNVADSCITVGAAFLIMSGFGGSGEPEKPDAQPEG